MHPLQCNMSAFGSKCKWNHHRDMLKVILVWILLMEGNSHGISVAAYSLKDDVMMSGVKRNCYNNIFGIVDDIPKKRLMFDKIHRGGAMAVSSKDKVMVSSKKLNSDHNGNATSLWSIRILFLTYYASLGSLLPYLPVYYHSLGHDGHYIGLLGAVNPFTTFLVAPLWGMMADRTNEHKMILKFTFVSSLLTRLCISLRKDVAWLVVTVFVTALLNAPVKSLLDSSVMNMLNNQGKQGSYGKLRLWGQLGFGLGSSGIGFLLHRSNLGYKIAFVSHALISLPTYWFISSFEHTHLEKKKEKINKKMVKKNVEKNSIRGGLKILIHNTDAMVFFFLVFVIGLSSGIIENFAYVRMREVGGTGREMGISRFVSSSTGVPMFWFSEKLTGGGGDGKDDADGKATRIMILSLLAYSIRFFIYASMKHPLGALPAEALRGATFGAFWSTATVYAHRISPPGLSATLLTILNAMYGGLGQSLGAIIGGKMQSKMGTQLTFIYSGIADITFICAFILYKGLTSSSSRNIR